MVGNVCGEGTYRLTNRKCSVASDRLWSKGRIGADRWERARVTVQEIATGASSPYIHADNEIHPLPDTVR